MDYTKNIVSLPCHKRLWLTFPLYKGGKGDLTH